jgi:hypothetical protein
MSDLVFYIGPFLGCKALLKMMTSILTPVNSFGAEGSRNYVAQAHPKPSPHIGPSFGDCLTHRAFPYTFETHPILQGFVAFVRCFCQLKRPLTIQVKNTSFILYAGEGLLLQTS